MIFSHVLYQLSYPGITICYRLAEDVAIASLPVDGPMANRIGLGKPKKHIR